MANDNRGIINGRARPVYNAASKARRKCRKCGATVFRAKRESFNGIVFALLICDNADCASVVAGGPLP